MAIDLDAPIRFLRTAYRPDDWIAVLLKSHETGGTAQRVGPLSLIASRTFQAWLRAQSARRFSVFVSVNAIRPQRKARTRDAIGEIRHVFLDADRDGPGVLAAIAARRDLPPPSYVPALFAKPAARTLARLRLYEGRRRSVAEAAGSRARDRQGRNLVRADHTLTRVLQPQVPPGTGRYGRVRARSAMVRASGFPFPLIGSATTGIHCDRTGPTAASGRSRAGAQVPGRHPTSGRWRPWGCDHLPRLLPACPWVRPR